jgi:hypothetical protein
MSTDEHDAARRREIEQVEAVLRRLYPERWEEIARCFEEEEVNFGRWCESPRLIYLRLTWWPCGSSERVNAGS